ncbi:hypothetical protein F2Q69_00042239 [Brassica cretica]|uniref:Uncharacterized protein n=1 Tax=Brassica cretica TaxID=69181 RepID=A0A8S9NRD9_BRACR|nr:hypothetical protein F2Q69_00042239 [Brassica cretica]
MWHDHSGMRPKAGMGMRKHEYLSKLPKTPVQPKAHRGPRVPMDQSKSCFSRRGKQRKPGTWVITPTPSTSKPVPVVALPRKAEYGPCEKKHISGYQGTPGLYASPRSKEQTQGSPNDSGSYGTSGSSQLQRTSGFQTIISGSTSPGSDMASKAYYDSSKKDRTLVQPRAHRGHYIPKEPPGSHTTSGSRYTRVPIRSPDLREKALYSHTTSGSE